MHLNHHFLLEKDHKIKKNYKRIHKKKIKTFTNLLIKIIESKHLKAQVLNQVSKTIKDLKTEFNAYLDMIEIHNKMCREITAFLEKETMIIYKEKQIKTENILLNCLENNMKIEPFDEINKFATFKGKKRLLKKQSCLDIIEMMSKALKENNYFDDKLMIKMDEAVELDKDLKILKEFNKLKDQFKGINVPLTVKMPQSFNKIIKTTICPKNLQ